MSDIKSATFPPHLLSHLLSHHLKNAHKHLETRPDPPPSPAAPPVLKAAHSKRVVAGRRLKLNCKVSNKAFPWPAIAWYKDGALLTNQEQRVTIHSKK